MSDETASWRADYPMSRLSSWRAGGRARWLFTPANVADMDALSASPSGGESTSGESPLFVGHGSNLLVRDGGYDGIVVRTAPGLSALRREEDGRVYAAAGVGCPKLAKFCAANGLAGGEFFAGIPGTVGGALAMNAGCHGEETWGRVDAAAVIAQGGVAETRRPDAFSISYRNVRAADAPLFVGAWFCFMESESAAVRRKLKELLQRRSETQPLGAATAGSVFCNPPGDYAGRLIEQCGLKGARVGGASVSTKHANFIVNDGGATAANIEELISLVRHRVADSTGVALRPEVRIVGKEAAWA